MSLPRLDFRTVDVSLPAQNPADLAAEIERLQHDLADLREAQAQHRMDNEHAYDEGYDAGTRRGYESECAAVVRFMREDRWAYAWACAEDGVMELAQRIERGEHRREEEP